MRRRSRIGIRRGIHILGAYAGVLLVVCLGCLQTPRSDRVVPDVATQAAFRRVTLGLCEDYPEESRSLAAARGDLALLKTNQIRVLRIAFGWDAMEPEPGIYDWSFWDDFVRVAVDDYGVQLIPYVCYTPRWASSCASGEFWNCPPTNNAAFASFLQQLVSRYKDRIHSWEIWNEPDNAHYWTGSAEQFADLFATAAQAVRETDPQARIVLGGLAWDLSFLEAMLTNAAVARMIDVVNLHNYYETWASEPMERLPDYVGRASDLIQQAGWDMPIWMAEIGYSSFRHGDWVSGQYRAHYRDEHTPDAQGQSLFRALTLLLSSGKVSLAAWYRINDLPATQEVIGDVNNRHLGLLDREGRPKPALSALRFFHSLFQSGFRVVDEKVRISKTLVAPVEVHAFELPDGSFVLAGWLRIYVAGERGAIAVGTNVNSRTARVAIAFPFRGRSSGSHFNAFGQLQGTAIAQQLGEKLELENWILRDGEISVLVFQRD